MVDWQPDDSPFARHFWPFYAMAVAPDGSWFVTGGGDGTLRTWHATGEAFGKPIHAESDWVLSVAISPDGNEIISGGGNGTVRRWDARTGDVIGEMPAHRDLVWSVRVSPDGSQIISGGGDATVRRWDARTGEPIGEPLRGGPVRAVTTSPDGSQIIFSGTDSSVRRRDAVTGVPIGEPLLGHRDWVHAVVVMPDGTEIVSGGGDGTLRRWDAVTGDPIGKPLTGHDGAVFAVAVTPDGTEIVSGGGDGTLRRWDAVTGDPIGEPFTGHTDWVRAVHVTADGRIISCGNDGTIRFWGSAGQPVKVISGPLVAVNALAVDDAAGEVISASIDGSLRRWDRDTGAVLGRLRAPDGWVNAITISPDGRQLIRAGEDGTIVRWDATTRERIEPPLTGHDGSVRAVAFTPDSRWIISVGRDGTVRRWDRDTGDPVGEPLTGHTGAVNAVVVTPAGDQIITAGSDDGRVLRWNVLTGATAEIGGHRGGALTVAVNRKGDRVVSGGGDGAVRVWDLRAGVALPSPSERHDGPVTVVRFTPDGRRIISGGTDHTVRQWYADTGAPAGAPLAGHENTVTSLAFPHDDGAIVLSGAADGTVRRWDLDTGTQVSVGTQQVVVPSVLLADVLSDLESSEDRLDIAEDVQRIGAMLAALSVRPPLSVALLGDWGTGKSTFMRQLRDWLSAAARRARPSAESPFASNVRQVTFNAWHYSDDHLWVGLIEHMFRELATDDTPTDDTTAEEVAEQKLKLSTRQAELARLSADLESIDRIGTERGWFGALRAPLRSARVAKAALASGWRELRGWRGWLTLSLTALGIAAVVLTVRFGQSQLAWVGGVVAAVGGLGTPVVTVWRRLTASTEDVRKQLLERKEVLDKEIRDADDKLGQLEPAHRLDRLLAEISTAERYESFRGLTGRIHHDLRRLSEDLVAARKAWSGKGRPPLQRIVLYVDDLDRCTPTRVVDVLQAVNLLLTMDLFMVVVAVDPRWLLKALSRHHRGLLRDAGQVSPLDYLDKIFHIPFALRPMGPRANAYLRSMLPVDEEPEPAPSQRPVPRTETAASTDAVPSVAPATGADPEVPVAQQESEMAPAHQEVARPVADFNLEGLRVRQAEQDFLAALTPLLPTPRAVKKLANLYRLVRLSIRPGQLGAFLGDQFGGPYQAAALLLAALVGAPREARELLVTLTAAPPEQDITQVLAGDGLPHRLATLIKELRGSGTQVHGDAATYRSWATAVARYGFETYDLFAERDEGQTAG